MIQHQFFFQKVPSVKMIKPTKSETSLETVNMKLTLQCQEINPYSTGKQISLPDGEVNLFLGVGRPLTSRFTAPSRKYQAGSCRKDALEVWSSGTYLLQLSYQVFAPRHGH